MFVNGCCTIILCLDRKQDIGRIIGIMNFDIGKAETFPDVAVSCKWLETIKD